MKSLIDRYHEQIDSLIALNQEFRTMINKDIRSQVSSLQYAISYCTVTCDIGRGLSDMEEYIKLRGNQNSLAIINRNIIRTRLKNYKYPITSAFDIINRNSLKGKQSPKIIYIDEWPLGPQIINLDDIYMQVINENIEQTFVIFGI